MAAMSDLRASADALLGLGLTKHRAFRVLRRLYPDAERDQLLLAIPLRGAPTGVTPDWPANRLRPVVIRQWGRKRAPGA